MDYANELPAFQGNVEYFVPRRIARLAETQFSRQRRPKIV
jgi:hypothetical protein